MFDRVLVGVGEFFGIRQWLRLCGFVNMIKDFRVGSKFCFLYIYVII